MRAKSLRDRLIVLSTALRSVVHTHGTTRRLKSWLLEVVCLTCGGCKEVFLDNVQDRRLGAEVF